MKDKFIFETKNQLKLFIKQLHPIVYNESLSEQKLNSLVNRYWNDLKPNEEISQFITDSDIIDLYGGRRKHG